MAFSLDISNHRRGINIAKLREQGLVHLYMKATEGRGYVDPSLNDFYNQAVQTGVPVGYYHFATKNPDIEGQAEDFYNAVKGKKADLRYCLDMESQMPSGVSHSDFARRFIGRFEELMGKSDICNIYASGYYARDNFDNDIKSRIPLWIAQYGKGPNNFMETGFRTICGHQYSENEYHEGQPCDSNIFYESIMIGSPIAASSSTGFNTGNSTTGGKIAELQRILGVTDDGIYGPQTDAALKNIQPAGLPYHTPQLTTWIQLRLGLEPDGIFGVNTCNAVKDWQRRKGLVVDGIAGYNTVKSLALA